MHTKALSITALSIRALSITTLSIRALPIRALLILTLLLLFAFPVVADELRTIETNYGLGDAERVHMLVPYGSLRVEAGDTNTVSVKVELSCDRADDVKCRKRAERIRLAARVRNDELKIKLERTGSSAIQGIHAEVVLRLPADIPLEIDQRGGDVFVTGMKADLLIGAVAGDIDVAGVREQTREVNVDVGIGSAELFLGDGSIEGAGFPRKLRWNGSGTALIKINLGTGDARVRFTGDN